MICLQSSAENINIHQYQGLCWYM